MSEILAAVVNLVLLLSLAPCVYLLHRNNAVYRESVRVLDAIRQAHKQAIWASRSMEALYHAERWMEANWADYEAVTYDRMLFSLKPVETFYKPLLERIEREGVTN